MNRVMSLIGSASGCKFRLADPSVSSFHCSLLRTPLGLWVIDLLAPAGVSVNDALVRYSLLADNDVLKVGRYRIRVHSRFTGQDPGGSTSASPRSTTITLSQPSRRNPLEPVFPQGDSRHSSSPVLGPTPWQGSGLGTLMPLQSGHSSTVGWDSSTDGPTRSGKGELSESVLVPLMNQFGTMQEQMLDQFQQAIAMLVQVFGNLHRDQMHVIRDELDQLRNLTKEFQTLKLELAAHSQVRPPITGASEFQTQSVQRIAGPEEQDIPGTEGAVNPVAARVGPTPGLIPPVFVHLSGSSSSDPKATPTALGSQVPLSPRSSPAPLESSSSGQPATRPAQATPGGSKLESDRDAIIWLHQRMMTLQQERESRWQKILKLLPGLS